MAKSLSAQFAYYDRLAAKMRNRRCADCRKPGPNARFDLCADCFSARVERVQAKREARRAPAPSTTETFVNIADAFSE